MATLKDCVVPASHCASVRSLQLIEAGGATGPYSVAEMKSGSPSSPETVTTSDSTVPGSPESAVTCVASVGVGTGGSVTSTVYEATPLGTVNVVTSLVGT